MNHQNVAHLQYLTIKTEIFFANFRERTSMLHILRSQPQSISHTHAKTYPQYTHTQCINMALHMGRESRVTKERVKWVVGLLRSDKVLVITMMLENDFHTVPCYVIVGRSMRALHCNCDLQLMMIKTRTHTIHKYISVVLSGIYLVCCNILYFFNCYMIFFCTTIKMNISYFYIRFVGLLCNIWKI